MGFKEDYANMDGKKIQRIMKATGNVFYQYPGGLIKTGGQDEEKN